MLQFLADENLDNRIVRGLELKDPSIEILTINEALRAGSEDTEVLSFAAEQGMILLTHDKHLIPSAIDRVNSGKALPGIFVIPQDESLIGRIIEDLILLAHASLPGEWNGQIYFLPLKT